MNVIKQIKRQHPKEYIWKPFVGDDGIYAPMIFNGLVYDQLIVSKEMFIEAYNKWIKGGQSVVHAKWIECNSFVYDNDGIGSIMCLNYVCSNCRSEEEYESDYCPNCGAHMDLEE